MHSLHTRKHPRAHACPPSRTSLCPPSLPSPALSCVRHTVSSGGRTRRYTQPLTSPPPASPSRMRPTRVSAVLCSQYSAAESSSTVQQCSTAAQYSAATHPKRALHTRQACAQVLKYSSTQGQKGKARFLQRSALPLPRTGMLDRRSLVAGVVVGRQNGRATTNKPCECAQPDWTHTGPRADHTTDTARMQGRVQVS